MKFAERLELIKQYNDGLVTFLEFCLNMHMDAVETNAAVLLKAAHCDIAMSPTQLANVMDDLVEKDKAGLQGIPQLVHRKV